MKKEVEFIKQQISFNILSNFNEYRIIKDIPEPKLDNIIITKITEEDIFFTIRYSDKSSKYKITWQLYLAESIINKN